MASDIIQAAIADASRIRLDAVRAGEQMYDEIVKSANARADEILAEAREEALRITSAAEHRAAEQTGANRGSLPAEEALDALRFELAAMVRQLRGNLESSGASTSGTGAGLECLVPGSAVFSEEQSSHSASPGPNGTYGPHTPTYPSHNGYGRKQDDSKHPDREDDGSWKPPDWMST